MVQLLRDSEIEFLGLVSALTEAQWAGRPAPDRWSVQQIAEHLVLGEAGMLLKIKEAMAAPPRPDWAEQDARKAKFLDRVLPDRNLKAAAPAPLHPHRGWTREETVSRYQAGRVKTLACAQELDRPWKSHVSEHPFPVFNMLNAYHWLLYIPLHNVRHNQQIAEVLKDLAL